MGRKRRGSAFAAQRVKVSELLNIHLQHWHTGETLHGRHRGHDCPVHRRVDDQTSAIALIPMGLESKTARNKSCLSSL